MLSNQLLQSSCWTGCSSMNMNTASGLLQYLLELSLVACTWLITSRNFKTSMHSLRYADLVYNTLQIIFNLVQFYFQWNSRKIGIRDEYMFPDMFSKWKQVMPWIRRTGLNWKHQLDTLSNRYVDPEMSDNDVKRGEGEQREAFPGGPSFSKFKLVCPLLWLAAWFCSNLPTSAR